METPFTFHIWFYISYLYATQSTVQDWVNAVTSHRCHDKLEVCILPIAMHLMHMSAARCICLSWAVQAMISELLLWKSCLEKASPSSFTWIATEHQQKVLVLGHLGFATHKFCWISNVRPTAFSGPLLSMNTQQHLLFMHVLATSHRRVQMPERHRWWTDPKSRTELKSKSN